MDSDRQHFTGPSCLELVDLDSDSALIGLRVQIIIDEDGTFDPPKLPPGTVIRSLTGTDRTVYFMVRLDNPVRSRRWLTGQDWMLHMLVINSRYKGKSLMDLLNSPRGKGVKEVTIGISNLLTQIPPDEILLDFSKVDYFALGRVSRILDQT